MSLEYQHKNWAEATVTMVILCGYALSLSVSLLLSLSFGTVYLLKYLSCRFRCLFFRIAVHLSAVHHLFVSLSHHSLHCVFFTVCPVLRFGQEVPFTEKTRESCYKVEWRVLPYLHALTHSVLNVSLISLTSSLFILPASVLQEGILVYLHAL